MFCAFPFKGRPVASRSRFELGFYATWLHKSGLIRLLNGSEAQVLWVLASYGGSGSIARMAAGGSTPSCTGGRAHEHRGGAQGAWRANLVHVSEIPRICRGSGYEPHGEPLPIEEADAEIKREVLAGGEAFAVGDLFTGHWQVYVKPAKKGRKAASVEVAGQ